MLYLLFTIDGDWKNYFNRQLSEKERAPSQCLMLNFIGQEIEMAQRNLEGKFIHFIHTSPRARDFFLKKPFITLWQEIIKGGGDIGIHCHEEDPYLEYYFQDGSRMEKVIKEQADKLRGQGLKVRAYRGGFLTFSKGLIPILERNNLCFDFSCEPERYLIHNRQVVSDWRDSPTSLYQMSYDDYKRAGDSGVFEIPIGALKGKYLYFEKSDLKELEEIVFGFKEMSEKNARDIIVSVLTHSYEYASSDEIKTIEEKISLLKKYGQFINLGELSELIQG